MTARAEYTQDEWDLLQYAPYAAGMAVAFADGSGVLETLRESTALIVSYVSGLTRYPDNELIKALASIRDTDTAGDSARAALEGIAPSEAPAHLQAVAVDACRRAAALLAQRSSAVERDGYLRWVMDAARATARAVRHGGFFSRGPLVDAEERKVLSDVADALGVELGDLPDETAAQG